MAGDIANTINNDRRGIPDERVTHASRAVSKGINTLAREANRKDGRGKYDPHAFDRKLFVFARPDGSIYETEFGRGFGPARWTAEAWAREHGDRLLSERDLPRQDPPSTTLEIEPPPGEKHTKHPTLKKSIREKKTQETKAAQQKQPPVPPPEQPVPTKPKKPREPIPKVEPETRWDVFKDYMHKYALKTTMEDSLPLASKWLRRAGKVMKFIPPLAPVSTIYDGIADGLDGVTLIYDLINELSQDKAFEKGSKEVVKRTKPVEKAALKVIKKKFPGTPEPIAKEMAKKLEEMFEKYLADPGIEKIKEKMKEQDTEKDLDKSLWRKWVSPTPIIP